MKKHGVLLDMIKDSITVFLRYCIHVEVLLSPIFLKPKGSETVLEAKYEDMVSNCILKRGSDENLDNILSINQKLSNKKSQLINNSKRKSSMAK